MATILLPLQLLLRAQSHEQPMLLIWSPTIRRRQPILPWWPLFNYCRLNLFMFGLQQPFCCQSAYGVELPVNMALAATFSLWSSFYKRGPQQHFCLSSRLLGGAASHYGHGGHFTFLEPLLSRSAASSATVFDLQLPPCCQLLLLWIQSLGRVV
jgi:hypothetical protein